MSIGAFGKGIVLGLAAFALMSTQSSASTYWWTFTSGPSGFGVPNPSVVDGYITGAFVNNGPANSYVSPVTVTVDYISTDPGWIPVTFSSYASITDVNNQLTHVFFQGSSSGWTILLNSAFPAYVDELYNSGFTHLYESGGYADPQGANFRVPEGGSTCLLLGLGLATLGLLRHQFKPGAV